ncbi:ABC transporter permease [Nocardioides humilatus]|uniref:ABC transporter permease n=1 Tax=Nocardioides humilatus TaxID=2607660 RepID=A0A5B1LM01_9ACTN|nr:ABC transporter permease [Nocardioides humilatus]KAA1421805.1 ABC transporter permease [Nocardioides humilatus]
MAIAETAVEQPTATSRVSGALHRVRSWEGIGLLSVLVLLYVVLSVRSPVFLTTDNQLSILQNAAFFGIVAFAMTLVIVAGEIDISVGSMAALSSSMLGVFVVKHGVPMPLAVLLVLLAAAAIGAFAGAMRAYFGVPTFIATLALYLALKGLAQLLTNNFPLPIDQEEFFYWGDGRFLGVPVPALYLIGTFVVLIVIAKYTVFGRSIYAVGGNAKSANLSGINVRRIKILVMMIVAVAAAITGLLQTALLASGNSTIAVGLEFDAIAATIIGGAALSGGKGSIVGTVMGVLFIAALLNGMVLLNVNPYAQQVVRGAVVLVAVLVNVWRTRKTSLE